MKRYCFALDLKEDPELIAAYEKHHTAVPPAVIKSIRDAGITDMQIYRTGNRLFMIMDTNEQFSPEAKAAADAANETVQQWEQLMWKYQQAVPGSKPGDKWIPMKNLFSL